MAGADSPRGSARTDFYEFSSSQPKWAILFLFVTSNQLVQVEIQLIQQPEPRLCWSNAVDKLKAEAMLRE